MPRVLVVDDDRAVLEMLVDALESVGYETGTCRDGKQVIEELRRQPCDLLLLDMLIPKVNGFALIEQLRTDPTFRDLPVIMMSGIYRSRNHRTEMTTRYGVIEYLDKPLKLEVLFDLVGRSAGPPARGTAKLPPDAGAPAAGDGAEAEPGAGAGAGAGAEAEGESRAAGAAAATTAAAAQRAQRSPAAPAAAADAASPASVDDAEIEVTVGVEDLVDGAAKEERKEVESAARHAFAPSAFVLQGTLKNQPVAALIGKLWSEQRTGALLLRRSQVKKIVYVRDGAPYSVRSNLVSECLGQVLVRERLISERDCAASIARMRETGQKQGEILVGMRCLTQKNLEFALELQMETKLFETFRWAEGEYRFNASAPLPDGPGFEVPTPALVVDGVRRTFDETRLRGLMLPIFDVPLELKPRPIDWGQLKLTAREQEAAESLPLPASTRSLLEMLSLDPPEALRLIYSLIVLELCQPARALAPAPQAAERR